MEAALGCFRMQHKCASLSLCYHLPFMPCLPYPPLSGRLPPEGKADDARIASSHKTFGYRLIYICVAPPFRMSRAGRALKCAKSGTLHGLPCFCFSFPTCVII